MVVMRHRACGIAGLAAISLLAIASPTGAVDISPHRAPHSLTLDSTKTASGVSGASGAMYYEWGEACDGWTVDQRFRLHIVYAEEGTVDINSTLLTWEAKDGLKYR